MKAKSLNSHHQSEWTLSHTLDIVPGSSILGNYTPQANALHLRSHREQKHLIVVVQQRILPLGYTRTYRNPKHRKEKQAHDKSPVE